MSKTTKSFICSIITLTLAFFMLCAAVYGWYSMNDKVGGGGMEIKALDHTMNLNYAVYKYDDELAEGVDATEDDDALSLSPYDSIIVSKNEYTPIIIKLILSGELNGGAGLTFRITCGESDLNKDVLSNIISVNIGYIEMDSIEPKDIYEDAKVYFAENKNTKKTFVALNDNTTPDDKTKEMSIDFDLSIFSSHIVDNSLTFYVEIDYDADLIAEKDYSASFADLETNVIYDSDLERIIIFGGNS